MTEKPAPAKVLSTTGRAVLLVGAVIGYCIGWYFRIQANMTGALFGALYGAGGVLVGMLIVAPLIFFVPGMMEDPPAEETPKA